MNLLDIRTVIVSYVISNFVCLVLMAVLWRQYHRRFSGMGLWLSDFLLQFAALVLLALRGVVPDVLSITLSNSMVIGGTILLYVGLERFTGKQGPQLHNIILLVAFVFAHFCFAFILPSMTMRTMALSLALLVVCFQCAWLLLRRVGPALRPVTLSAGYVFVGFCLISIVRIVVDIAVPPQHDFFHSNVYDTLSLITYQMLFIVLTLSLFLMVNRRLFGDLETEITERERAEEIVRLRLRLWEYAADHSIDDLMKTALDEIGELTDSPIGFYHFVQEDQNTLSLQAWSTRTVAEFCQTEGKGMHYPISEAGVWVDCVHQRKPVIHNDYSALPHRKGLPAGHAAVIRELVVPTMRNDRIVSILGVGNKATDYTDQDVELVLYIADIVWTILEQKQTNEQIHQLNAKLERLAMTDDLTGLLNRRSFFSRGTEEIQRSERYCSPLSILMMDLDHFKEINDTYGHDAGDWVQPARFSVHAEQLTSWRAWEGKNSGSSCRTRKQRLRSISPSGQDWRSNGRAAPSWIWKRA